MEIKVNDCGELAFQARIQKRREIYRAERARLDFECMRKYGVKPFESTIATMVVRERFEERRIMSDEEISKIPLMVVRYHLEERKKWPRT